MINCCYIHTCTICTEYLASTSPLLCFSNSPFDLSSKKKKSKNILCVAMRPIHFYTIRSVASVGYLVRDWKAECGVVIYPSVSTTRTSECVVVIYRYIKYKNYTTCFFENSSTATTPVVYSSFTFLNIPRGFKSCNSGGKRLSGQS